MLHVCLLLNKGKVDLQNGNKAKVVALTLPNKLILELIIVIMF
jgi:hypothetical protein